MDDFRPTDEGLPTERDSGENARPTRKSSGGNSSEWLVNVEDDVVVPMITSEIVEAFHAGRVTQRTLVWRIGMHDWSALAEVPQLRLSVGPSPLPSATSAQRPSVHDALTAPPDPQRPSTLSFGFPAVRDAASVRQPVGLGLPTPPSATPHLNSAPGAEDIDAMALYEPLTAGSVFADALGDEWQGQASSPALGVASARLTPVPPGASRLPLRPAHALPPNSLAPTTSEAAIAASAHRLGAAGDKNVVFARELRTVKTTSKRLALWAALGSAVVASVATFWIARSAARPADQVQAAPQVVASQDAPSVRIPAPETAPTVASAAHAASVISAPPVAAAQPSAVRVAKRVKRAPPAVAASASDAVGSATAPGSSGNAGEVKPSVAASLPLGASRANAMLTAAPSAAPPVATPPRNAPSGAPTPGF